MDMAAAKIMYVHPQSLRDPIKRLYLKESRLLGLKIRVEILGKKNHYWRCTIGVEAEPSAIRALKRLGIKVSKHKIPALFSGKVLAELVNTWKKRIPVGIGPKGEVIYIGIDRPIATNNPKIVMGIADTPVLWIDLKGDEFPLGIGYKECSGIPLPSSETKMHNLANSLAKLLRTSPERVLSAIKSRIGGVLEDKELVIGTPAVDSLFEWGIITTEEEPYLRSYIDFSGLPYKMAICAVAIVNAVWDHYLVVRIPRAWRWVTKILEYRAKTIIYCDNPQTLNIPTIVLEDKVILKLRFKDTTEIIEKNYTPFWKILEGG